MAASAPNRYGVLAQSLHWVIAGLVATQFVLANLADDLPVGMQKLALLARHKSFGMTILMLAILRLGWRLYTPPPPLPAAMKTYERRLARVSHALFYLLLFAMPLTGWLMSSAKGYTVSWFGWFSWPDLIGRDEGRFETLRSVHDALAKLLFFAVTIHIVAALKHHFWDKDEVLKRMLPFTKTGRER